MKQTAVGRVFILESPNALDLLQERGERSSLEQVCRIFGHEAYSFLLRDSKELEQTLTYISSIGWFGGAEDLPLFIHISVHGNQNEIAVGSERITWSDLAGMITEMYKNLDGYEGPIVLILSACGADKNRLTTFIRSKHLNGEIQSPPGYIFVFTDEEITWTDAVVTWTVFYHKAASLKFKKGDALNIRKLLNQLRELGLGKLKYYRWDSDKKEYVYYAAKAVKKKRVKRRT